jgi:hypothetical protein
MYQLRKEIEKSLYSQCNGNIVKLEMHSNMGFVTKDYIEKVLDCLDGRFNTCAAGLDVLNPLEKLGLELLLDSAYMRWSVNK